MNSTGHGMAAPPLSDTLIFIFGSYFFIVVLLGLVGNTFVLLTVYRYKCMRTTVNYHLVNLATADLMIIVLSILELQPIIENKYRYSLGFCKLQGYLMEAAFTAMSLTLASVSMERYFAICQPYKWMRKTSDAVKVSAFIWLVSLSFCGILLYSYDIQPDAQGNLKCLATNWSSASKQVTYSLHTALVYVIPLAASLWAHINISRALTLHRTPSYPTMNDPELESPNAESIPPSPVSTRHHKLKITTLPSSMGVRLHGRKKIIRMLAIVTLVFVVLWTPFIVVRLLRYYFVMQNDRLWRFTQLFMFSSTATNGVIYVMTSQQYKRCFKDIFRWITCRRTDFDLKMRRRASSLSGIHRIRLNDLQLTPSPTIKSPGNSRPRLVMAF